MRCLILLFGAVSLSGCAIDPGTSSQLISGESSRINALSNINRQIVPGQTGSTEQNTFAGCLAAQQKDGIVTLARYLTSDKQGTHSPASITITSDSLSSYTNALWNYSRQNKSVMLDTVAIHRAHDKTCFEREILALKNGAQPMPTNGSAKLSLADYEQSQKILGNIYDYLHSTLSVTEYSELNEQFARDHIPVRVLMPTS